MYNNTLEELFTNQHLLTNISNTHYNLLTEHYKSNSYTLFINRYCTGRGINTAYARTVGRYYNKTLTMILLSLCSTLHYDNPTYSYTIVPYWLSISSEDNATKTLDAITTPLFQQTNNMPYCTHKIHLIHVASGKSYLKQKLTDELQEDLPRYNNIELLLTTHVSHFIRVYQGFPGTHAEDITVFTDYIDEPLIYKLILLLPHLFHLTPEYVSQLEIENKEEWLTKTETVFNIFKDLFECCNTLNHTETNDETPKLKAVIDKIKTYIDKLQLNAQSLDSFITTFANRQNYLLKSQFEDTIATTERYIKSLEADIEQHYKRRMEAQQALLGIQQVAPTDLQDFKNTLLSNQAIEIIETTKSYIIMRITAPLQYYNKSDFERHEKNPYSDYNDLFKNKPLYKKVLHEIFITQKYQILIQAMIKLDLTGGQVMSFNAIQQSYTHQGGDLTQIANPHLNYYNCWSTARNELLKHVSNKDYDLIIPQIIAAVQAINVAEQPSFVNKFLRDVKHSPGCITLIDTKTKQTLKWDEALNNEDTEEPDETPIAEKAYTQQVLEEETITTEEAMEELEQRAEEAIEDEILETLDEEMEE